MIYLTDTQLLLIAGICAAGILIVILGALLTGSPPDYDTSDYGDKPGQAWSNAQDESWREANRR